MPTLPTLCSTGELEYDICITQRQRTNNHLNVRPIRVRLIK